jgi:hypothetical protein
MAVDHVKSTPITNSDATPVVANNTGGGAQGHLKEVTGSSVAVASSSADATYRFCRVPSNAKVKRVVITSEAQGAGKLDIGVYYPTTGPTGVADLAANAIDQDFFATVVDCASAVQPTDITNESGTYTIDKWNKALWDAVGLTSDPGGYFDIVGTVKTTAVTTGTGIWGLSVAYVE